MLTEILLLAFAGLMVAAAFSDAVRFTIPNWLCGVIAAGFPLVAVAAGLGWADAGLHVLAGLVALVFGFALFAPGWSLEKAFRFRFLLHVCGETADSCFRRVLCVRVSTAMRVRHILRFSYVPMCR